MEISKNYQGTGSAVPKTEKSNKKITFLSLEEGDNIYRILPPLGSMAAKNMWSKFARTEMGYSTSKGKNRAFQCPRVVNKKTKMVEVESAAHLKREKLKAQLDKLKKMKDDKSITQEKYDELSSPILKSIKSYWTQAGHYVNAISLDGKIGLLRLPYTVKQLLDEEIKKLESKGVFPLSVENGRFFNISRTGEGFNTNYQVTIYQEEIDVGGEIGVVKKDKKHVLTNEIIERLKNEAFDLGDLDRLYPKLSAEQVERVVNGKPEDYDAVLKEYYDQFKDSTPTAKSESTSEKHDEMYEEMEEEYHDSASTPHVPETPQANVDVNSGLSQEEKDFLASLG